MAIKEITDRLPEHEWHLFTARMKRDLPRVEKMGNVVVHRVGPGWGNLDKLLLPKLGTLRVLTEIRKNKPDLFWGMMVTFASGIPYMVNILRPWNKIPVVLTLQEGDSEVYIQTKKFGLAGFLWRVPMLPVTVVLPRKLRKLGLIGVSWALALPRTKLVTVISNYLGTQARAYGYKGPIELVPNAVDTKKFTVRHLSLEERRELRREFGFGEGDVVLITTSRLVEKNAVDDIIQSLKFLPENVKLLIAGIGPLESNLKLQVQKAKLEKRVTFLGFIDNEKLSGYLHSSDIFVRPSLSEGMGISFLEAMAVGLPVVATTVGGIADFLEDGVTGYVCEVKNPESIAWAVERIVADKTKANEVIERAKRMVENRYTWEKIAPEMERALQKAKG